MPSSGWDTRGTSSFHVANRSRTCATVARSTLRSCAAVEAVVTDRQGNRVTGLKPGDFRLEVDGKAVPIEYFNEVRGGQAQRL